MFWLECITCRGLCRACPKYKSQQPCNSDCKHHISMNKSDNKLINNKGKIRVKK